jgi:dihydroorotase
MSDVVLKNATIVDGSGSRQGDVAIRDGVIHEVGEKLGGGDTVDLDGLVLMPGLVDLHTHLREPGDEEAETIETGSRAAALGGYTAVVAMPNTNPTIDSAAVVEQVRRCSSRALCDVVPSAAITVGRNGELLAPMAELVRAGVRIFTDDGRGVQDPRLMRTAFEYAAGLAHLAGGTAGSASGVVLAQHCEVDELAGHGVMHEGEWSSRLGLPGQPAEAEELMIHRDLALAGLTGGRLHIQHVSTAGGVEMIRTAKAAGIAVTAEVTPHHLVLDHSHCAGFDPVFKVHPPLRTAADVAALRAGLQDQTIDAIATDHAPHTQQAKECSFLDAAPGMLGLETALAVVLTELDLDLSTVVRVMSINPARIAGLDHRHGGPIAAGRPANLTVVDPNVSWTVQGSTLASRSSNTAFEGRVLRGGVIHTLCDGEFVVRDGEATR